MWIRSNAEDGVVHCRIGSLEMTNPLVVLFANVHCRIGSLEMQCAAWVSEVYRSLPHRQFRNATPSAPERLAGSLPHRQFRNLYTPVRAIIYAFTAA